MEIRMFDKIMRVPAYVFAIIAVIFMFLGVFLYSLFTGDNRVSSGEVVTKDKVVQKEKEEKDKKVDNELISVYIVGCVKKQKVVEVEAGSTVAEIVEKVGGATKEAALDSVNLAHKPVDSEMIKIPSKKEVKEGNIDITVGNGDSSQENDGKVNINTADISELITLTGIGEATAKKIIDYRESNGKFENIEDIKNVSGIGATKYQSIKENITI